MYIRKMLINPNDLIGKQVGLLKVIAYNGNYAQITKDGIKQRHTYLCQCVCGKFVTVRRCHLQKETIRSCGCLRKQDTKIRYYDLLHKHVEV